MVDNFALVVSQLMLIIVLWRCYFQPEDGGAESKPKLSARNPRQKRECGDRLDRTASAD
ncbi:MAG: hypothetical protein H3C60_04810 [Sphingomonadaceae bacterium]|nr:hypothetical protein [Sphingomonadaceae bacterium]